MSITYIIYIMLISQSLTAGWFFPSFEKKRPFSFIIAPSGDAHNPGRTIDDTTERALSFSIAEHLKKLLERQFPSMNVILSRTPGQSLAPLQLASFANRTNADLVISISCYSETETKSHINVFQFSYNQDFVTKLPELALYPYDKAYIPHALQSGTYAQKIIEELQKNDLRTASIRGPYKLPYKPLIGIQAPALGFELGIQSKEEGTEYTQALFVGIMRILNEYDCT